MLFLLLFSTTVGEGRLWERLGIYSGNLFIAIKFVGFIMKNSGKSRMVIFYTSYIVFPSPIL